VRGDKLVLNFREGTVNLDLLLPGAEHDARVAQWLQPLQQAIAINDQEFGIPGSDNLR
jgi:hypothetical protein